MPKRVDELNYMANLDVFLAQWDSTDAGSTEWIEIKENRVGQKNLTGETDAPAAALTPRHPQFAASLEEGVKELVLFLVYEMRCITYSSCEGHRDSENSGRVRHARHVGILPRDSAERLRLAAIFSEATRNVNARSKAVSVVTQETTLESNHGSYPCIDINFLPVPGHENLYFEILDELSQSLIDEIRDIAPNAKPIHSSPIKAASGSHRSRPSSVKAVVSRK